MQFHLVVTNPFGGHAAGDLITDPELVEQLLPLQGERVVKIVPPKPAVSGPFTQED